VATPNKLPLLLSHYLPSIFWACGFFNSVSFARAIWVRSSSIRIGLVYFCVALIMLTSTSAEARRTGAARSQKIDMVVIHSTGGPTCDNAGKPIWVSAGTMDENVREIEAHPKLGIHYMIDRDGTLRSSVPEEQVAHHVMTYSLRSIAIELINDGNGIDPFPEVQLDSLVKLLRDIKERRGIKREGVKRHSDLDLALSACNRKQRRKVDPGKAFPYESVLERIFSP
jgi:N-acetylmuramoyl-L-alanine amidase